jgi:hypothetical protein
VIFFNKSNQKFKIKKNDEKYKRLQTGNPVIFICKINIGYSHASDDQSCDVAKYP